MFDSRARPRAAAALACALAALLLGCDGSDAPSDGGAAQRVLAAVGSQDVGLSLGQTRTLVVRYGELTGTATLAGETVRFAIFGDPRGSTLSRDSAVTNAEGLASVSLRAGSDATSFRVIASAEHAGDLPFYVQVGAAGFATLEVDARYAERAPPSTRVRYFLVRDASCADVSTVTPPPTARTRDADAADKAVRFGAVPVDTRHALLARAEADGGAVRAAGCIDLTPAQLAAGLTMRVTVTLAAARLRADGRYRLVSTITLPKARALQAALAPLGDAADCPNDPAQLLLDCVLDARDPGDPLDCKIEEPSALTRALIAERGVLNAGCRGDKTARGGVSLEALLRAAGTTADVAALTKVLETVATRALPLLAELSLESTLDLSAADGAGRASASHRLTHVSFGPAASAQRYALASVGVVKPLALPVDATLQSGPRLALSEHQLSLAYGVLARDALGKAVFAAAKLPATSAGLARAIAQLYTAQVDGRTARGCPAIEAIVCPAARLPQSCLAACSSGVDALGRYFDAGFADLARGDAELTLGGSVPLVDSDGDLRVDALGDANSASTLGGWSGARLRLAGETITPLSATFVGQR